MIALVAIVLAAEFVTAIAGLLLAGACVYLAALYGDAGDVWAVTLAAGLFVIIGRRTFSAGQQFTNLLEAWTQATLVGEPTGQRPSQYGDHRRLPLAGVGFSLFTMVLGFLWLNSFSKFNYDHRLAGVSAATSALLFLLPALSINAPVRQALVLSPRAVELRSSSAALR